MPPTTAVAQPAPAIPAVTPPTPAPTARSDGNIPVTFETPDEDRTYSISVVQQGRTQSCVAPCTLSLQQGAAYVTVGGDASFSSTLVVTPATSQVTISLKRHGQEIAGLVITSIGTLNVGIAAILAGGEQNPPIPALLGWAAGGVIVGVTGLIIMATSGSDKVTAAESALNRRGGLHFAGLGAAPLPRGGGVVGASFTF